MNYTFTELNEVLINYPEIILKKQEVIGNIEIYIDYHDSAISLTFTDVIPSYIYEWKKKKKDFHKNDKIGSIEIKKYDTKGYIIYDCIFHNIQLLDIEDNKVIFTYDYYLDKENKQDNDKYGYHTHKIEKGVLGSLTKIQEELDELKDAEEQKSKILIMVELSDLYGAIEEYCINQNINMEDLKTFSDITKRAFKNGRR